MLRSLEQGDDKVNDFHTTRELALGDPDDRRRAPAVWDRKAGQYEGGTAFERSGSAHPVLPGLRAFGMATSIEQPTQLFAPAVGNKTSPAAVAGPGVDMRSQLTKVCDSRFPNSARSS